MIASIQIRVASRSDGTQHPNSYPVRGLVFVGLAVASSVIAQRREERARIV